MKLAAFRFEQKGVPIYLTVLTAKILTDEARAKVDRWSPTNIEGYQRQVQDKRANEAAWYVVKSEGWFPTSVLVSVRAEVKFDGTKNHDGFSEGELTIPEGTILWIIDGQHRVEGLRRAIEKGSQDLSDYPVPVALVANPEKVSEMRMFYIVNTRAKSVPGDIADRLLQQALKEKGSYLLEETEYKDVTRSKKAVFQARATNIVDQLSANCPAWKGFVSVPGAARPHPLAAKQHTLVSSLLEGALKDPTTERLDDKSIGNLLDNYWSAMMEVFPEAFKQPEGYSIRRTAGLYSLHMLFPDILERCRETKDYSTAHMRQILSTMNLPSDFWSTNPDVGDHHTFGTGMKSLRLLADYLRSLLPPIVLAGM